MHWAGLFVAEGPWHKHSCWEAPISAAVSSQKKKKMVSMVIEFILETVELWTKCYMTDDQWKITNHHHSYTYSSQKNTKGTAEQKVLVLVVIWLQRSARSPTRTWMFSTSRRKVVWRFHPCSVTLTLNCCVIFDWMVMPSSYPALISVGKTLWTIGVWTHFGTWLFWVGLSETSRHLSQHCSLCAWWEKNVVLP